MEVDELLRAQKRARIFRFSIVFSLIFIGTISVVGVRWILWKAAALEKEMFQFPERSVALSSVQIKIYEAEGALLAAEVFGKKEFFNKDTRITVVEGVEKAIFYDAGEQQGMLTAKKAEYFETAGRIVFTGKVRIRLKDDTRIQANTVLWNKYERILMFLNKGTIADAEGNRLTAEIGILYTRNRRMDLFSSVLVNIKSEKKNSLRAEYLNYFQDFQRLEAHGKEEAQRRFKDFSYYARGYALAQPKFRSENAQLQSGNARIFAPHVSFDIPAKKGSVTGGKVEVSAKKGKALLEAQYIEFYWELGYVFAKNRVSISLPGQDRKVSGAEGIFVEKEQTFKIANNVQASGKNMLIFPEAGAEEAEEGTLSAQNLTIHLSPQRFFAEGSVVLIQGNRKLEASSLFSSPDEKHITGELVHFTSPSVEVFAKKLDIQGGIVQAEGNVRIKQKEKQTEAEAQSLVWRDPEDYELLSSVKGSYQENLFQADSLKNQAGKISLKGNVQLQKPEEFTLQSQDAEIIDDQVNAEGNVLVKFSNGEARGKNFTKKGNQISLKGLVSFLHPSFYLGGEFMEWDIEKKQGKVSEVKEMVLKRNIFPEEWVKTEPPQTRIDTNYLELSAEPTALYIPGKSRVRQGEATADLRDMRWGETTGLQASSLLLHSAQSFLQEGKEFSIRAEKVRSTEKEFQLHEKVEFREGRLQVFSDALLLQSEQWKMEGNIRMWIATEKETVEVRTPQMTGFPEGSIIVMEGGVQVETANTKISGKKGIYSRKEGYFQILDEVQVEYADGMVVKGSAFVYDLTTGQFRVEDSQGTVVL